MILYIIKYTIVNEPEILWRVAYHYTCLVTVYPSIHDEQVAYLAQGKQFMAEGTGTPLVT